MIKKETSEKKIVDKIRGKYLHSMPEEVVRQKVVDWLINTQKISSQKISIEKEIIVSNKARRYDIVVYGRELKPILLVECKAPNVKISQSTLDQILVYQKVLKVPFLILTNEVDFWCYRYTADDRVELLEEIPDFKKY